MCLIMKGSIVTAKILFVLWTNTNSWGQKSHNFSFNNTVDNFP